MKSFKFVRILMIFTIIFHCLKSDDEISCTKLPSLDIHPLECCTYPKFIDDSESVISKCTTLCSKLPSPSFHCVRNCKITESGIIKRGTFNSSKAINLFYLGGYYDPTELTEEWKEIVEKSAEKCEKEVPIKDDIKDDDYNYFYTIFIECIRMENFLACPDFSNSTKCENVKSSVENCENSNYDILHEFFFEDFYYKNSNVTMIWTTRTTATEASLLTDVEITTPTTRSASLESTTNATTALNMTDKPTSPQYLTSNMQNSSSITSIGTTLMPSSSNSSENFKNVTQSGTSSGYLASTISSSYQTSSIFSQNTSSMTTILSKNSQRTENSTSSTVKTTEYSQNVTSASIISNSTTFTPDVTNSMNITSTSIPSEPISSSVTNFQNLTTSSPIISTESKTGKAKIKATTTPKSWGKYSGRNS